MRALVGRSGRVVRGAAVLLIAACLAPMPAAAAVPTDSDHDGLPNWFERERSRTSPFRKDTDRDRIADSVEDPDRDGLWNRYEYLAGSASPAQGHGR